MDIQAGSIRVTTRLKSHIIVENAHYASCLSRWDHLSHCISEDTRLGSTESI